MDITDYTMVKLSNTNLTQPFDCGDTDLNDFLITQSLLFTKSLLATTYALISKETNDIVAYFSILNDKISMSDFPSKRKYWAFVQELRAVGKGFRSYPAVKIGRFAINKKYQKLGIGLLIIDFLKNLFILDNRTGCKYLTVDAYRSATPFYEKNGFKYLSESDKDAETRLMYFDLIQLMED